MEILYSSEPKCFIVDYFIYNPHDRKILTFLTFANSRKQAEHIVRGVETNKKVGIVKITSFDPINYNRAGDDWEERAAAE